MLSRTNRNELKWNVLIFKHIYTHTHTHYHSLKIVSLLFAWSVHQQINMYSCILFSILFAQYDCILMHLTPGIGYCWEKIMYELNGESELSNNERMAPFKKHLVHFGSLGLGNWIFSNCTLSFHFVSLQTKPHEFLFYSSVVHKHKPKDSEY